MNTTTSKTREQFPLSRKKIFKKTLTGVIGFILLEAIAAVIIMAAANDPTSGVTVGDGMYLILILAGVLLVLIIGIWLYQRAYFARYFYDLAEHYVMIRKGVITPQEITIPYERIQDVYVDQDLFDRILGLYDVHLSSATASSGLLAHIDGVGKAAADGLRAQLLSTIKHKNA